MGETLVKAQMSKPDFNFPMTKYFDLYFLECQNHFTWQMILNILTKHYTVNQTFSESM